MAAIPERQVTYKNALVSSRRWDVIPTAARGSSIPEYSLNTFPENRASMMEARISMLKSAFVSGGNANKFKRLRCCIRV
jgi:hypothetical protein